MWSDYFEQMTVNFAGAIRGELKKSDYYFTQNVSDRRESFISRQARFISPA